ncbi:MAG: EF-hand domain-containing protein [Pirellula sp.]
MKRLVMQRLLQASLLGLVGFSVPCYGQDPRPEPPAEGRRPGQGRLQENRPGFGGPGNPEMAARGMAMMLQNMPLFKALDADGDGQFSASEIENASKSLLKLDKNGDGVLSAEEMRPDPSQMPMFAGPNGPGRPGEGGAPGAPGQGASPEMMKRMFENRDQDKDGKLSGDEIPPQMRERLSNMDTNGDGAIDKTEMEQAMKRLEGMRPGNRRPEGRPEGRGEGGEGVRPRRPSSDK